MTRGHFLTSASKFNIEPNGGIFYVSPQNDGASPNVKSPFGSCVPIVRVVANFKSEALLLWCGSPSFLSHAVIGWFVPQDCFVMPSGGHSGTFVSHILSIFECGCVWSWAVDTLFRGLSEAVFTLGDARSFSGLTSKNLWAQCEILTPTSKNMTACHQC